MEVTKELLQELLEYDEVTGKLWWKPRGLHLFEDSGSNSARTICKIWNTRFAGKQAGTYITKNGYCSCKLMGNTFTNHRLIWMLRTGRWPKIVDHIDGDKTNNSWNNLREVSSSESSKNKPLQSNNSSGVTGVRWCTTRNRWVVEVGSKYLKSFRDFDEAVEARKTAEQSHGYHKNHGRERV